METDKEREQRISYEIYTTTTGSPRFGDKRAAVVGCKCTHNFTCRACLNQALSPLFTPSSTKGYFKKGE